MKVSKGVDGGGCPATIISLTKGELDMLWRNSGTIDVHIHYPHSDEAVVLTTAETRDTFRKEANVS